MQRKGQNTDKEIGTFFLVIENHIFLEVLVKRNWEVSVFLAYFVKIIILFKSSFSSNIPSNLKWLYPTQNFSFFKFVVGQKTADFFGTTNIEYRNCFRLFWTWTIASFLIISSTSFTINLFSSFIFVGGRGWVSQDVCNGRVF